MTPTGAIRLIEPERPDAAPAVLPQAPQEHAPAARTARLATQPNGAQPNNGQPRTTPAQIPRGIVVPPGLPGSDAPSLQLPPHDPDRIGERLKAIAELFPPLPALPAEIQTEPAPGVQPWSLAQLEGMALATSPVLRQAIADVNATQGAAVQAGLHPNPIIGYEGDTVGSGGTANYHGAFFDQLIKTAGKLDLARQTKLFDVRNAQLALGKTRVELITSVQARYYAVLVAQEAVRSLHALANFTDLAYRMQVEQLRGGEAAAYEPMQLRVLAIQARTALVQARNRYFAAWNQLAAVVNAPGMPPEPLAGNVNLPVPVVRFDLVRDHMLRVHPDIQAAFNSELQARSNLRLQQVTPIPDLTMYFALQKDYTSPPYGATFNTQIGMPTAIFDRNTGAILQAQGELAKASQQAARVRNQLVASLAEAFERYENSRANVDFHRAIILPDQFRVYRSVYERHQQQPDRVTFDDVVLTQQTMAASIGVYIQALGVQWSSLTDLLNLLQLEDVGELAMPMEQVPVPPPAVAP